LKIFYIYFHSDNFVPIHSAEVIRQLRKRGHKVHVFTKVNGEEARQKLCAEKIALHNVWTPQLRFISELVFMTLLLPILFILSLSKKPDAFYNRHSATAVSVALISKLLKIPCLFEVNDIVIDKLIFLRIPKFKQLWIKLYCYISFRLGNMLLPVTEQIGSWLRETYNLNKNKIVVIPNGVNVHRFRPKPKFKAREKYDIPIDVPVILSLGSLFPWAGTETLVTAAPNILKVYPKTIFLIGSGEEPFLSELKKIVKKSGLERNFIFTGFVPWDEAAWFISSADICVAPFIFKKNRSGICSLRVLSYMACSKPIIGSDIPGLGDLLEEKKIGFSFRMDNADNLTAKIINLLKNEKKIKEMGDKARIFVCNNFSWEIIVKQLETQILKLTLNNSL
jgi:glycosyltransferase involved in cell wall biosynthesis